MSYSDNEIRLKKILEETFETNELEDLVKELIQKNKQFDKNSLLLLITLTTSSTAVQHRVI